MDIIMLALIILGATIAVPTLIYLWLKWYYNELDRLINYKYSTNKGYIIANFFGTALLFGACISASWLILDPSSNEDYLFCQIALLVLCIIIDLVLIMACTCISYEEGEFDEYKNSFIYIIQFILIIPISICIVFNLIKYEPNDLSNKKRKSIAEQLNEDINDGYNI